MSNPDWDNIKIHGLSKYILGRAVTKASLPSFNDNEALPLLFDKATGRLLADVNVSGANGSVQGVDAAGDITTSDPVQIAGIESGGTTVRELLTDATGKLYVITNDLSPSTGSFTNRSGTIALGGTRQQVMAANSSRKYLFFQNVSDTDMWINFGVNAVADQPSIYIAPGADYVLESSFVSTQAVDVMCATTGKSYTAKEA